MIVVLAGGVGAARMCTGLLGACKPDELVAVVNTADDAEIHGLHVSPDIDTMTYTLAGRANQVTGWGLEGETWAAMEGLERFKPYGAPTWFRLGDRDLATHLHRTGRLRHGATLSEVTAEISAAFGLAVRLLPMSDDTVRTCIVLRGSAEEVGFQDYFVRLGHSVPISAVRFDGAARARPAPGVIDALAAAEMILIAPSNPVVSIGPILAVPGIAEAVRARCEATVAVSPIVAGAALKGPADRMLAELGEEPSVLGVADRYAGLAGTLVIDVADRALADQVGERGLRCVVAETVMSSREVAVELARVVIAAGGA